ncbi:MAG TPA: aspartyl/asparaginyl beta-hydroxylase domain-containing protein [Bacteroidia bacterium]|jgi:aspartyl/asparaginyl beta-hydroxylase (cupin superfamily)
MQKLWFSIYDFSFNYPGPEPAFADPVRFEWANELATETEKIKQELKDYISHHQLEAYFNSSMVSKQHSWKTIALKTWGVQLFKNQKQFPYTTSLINKYPEIVSASFNLLEPGSSIHPHCGDTNAIYRCHLGLEVPAGLPTTGFKVKGEAKAWKNGEWLIFMDAYEHEAWNHSTEKRYIFLIDVIRPEFRDKKKLVCSTVLTSLYLQKRAEKLKLLLKMNPLLITAITRMLRPLAQSAISIANALKIY